MDTNKGTATQPFSVTSCKIFLVGAGGIGCELLKNLVMSGFRRIDVIDLDTIEVSNLNRQFLFRREHVGQPKAIVACEAARKLIVESNNTSKNPAENIVDINNNANIIAHHDTIFSSAYGVSFVKKFDLVINALDNLKARSHMNRLCLAANVPLIETGSRGWMGQTYLILRGQTECFDCVTKKGDRTFAGCTIRNTPSEPIHCIVWAKFLFNQLFGEHDPDQDVSPDDADPELMMIGSSNSSVADGAGPNRSLAAGDVAVNGDLGTTKISKRVTARQLAEKCNYNFPILFNKFFNTDIMTLCSMSKLWTPGRGRRAPEPLQYDQLSNIANASGMLANTPTSSSSAAAAYDLQRERNVALEDERLWSPRECADVFAQALMTLFTRASHVKAEQLKHGGVKLHAATDTSGGGGAGDSGPALLVWDKDDDDAMDFLAAAANLRSLSFHIPMQSRFRIKSMAGRIVPAVAATNAIVAALAMRHVWQVLKHDERSSRPLFQSTAYLNTQRDYMGHKRIIASQHARPNPSCLICSMASGQRQLTLRLNPQLCTIGILEDEILKKELRFAAPDCQLTDRGAVLISSEAGETDAIRGRTLASMGVSDGSLLVVDDFLQEMKIQIVVLADTVGITDANTFQIIRDGEQAAAEAATAVPATAADTRVAESAAEAVPSPKKLKTASGVSVGSGIASDEAAGLLGVADSSVNVTGRVSPKRKLDELMAAHVKAKATTILANNNVNKSVAFNGGGGDAVDGGDDNDNGVTAEENPGKRRRLAENEAKIVSSKTASLSCLQVLPPLSKKVTIKKN